MYYIMRITENKLRRIIRESINRVLKESEEDFVSPLQRTKNNKPKLLGQMQNFNRDKGHIEVDGQWVTLRQAKAMARESLIKEMEKNGETMRFYAYNDGDCYGTLEVETEDGWYFIAEEIPAGIEIDRHAYYTPATWWDPEEYGDTEAHVEGVDFDEAVFVCYPPQNGKEQSFELKVDPELEQVLRDKCNTDELDDDLLCKLEELYSDHQAGLYDDYINRLIDER